MSSPGPASKHLFPAAETAAQPSDAILAARARDELERLLEILEGAVVPEQVGTVEKLHERLHDLTIPVALVGQVKAGKTALANALIGKFDMLPSDVNPWTSVVTSVHINIPKPRGHSAVFNFFTREEWDRMVGADQNMGELAGRADHEDEGDTIRAQIAEMKEKAEARLGQNFEYLLGSSHAYVGFHPELLKRYVCLGTDEDEREGQFADLTRTADLYIEDADWALPTIIRDMPGVNDPFLVRETVTLDHLSGAGLCVIVLNATQAFTTADMALVRILMSMRNEQIVLYVNRVDELCDPHSDIVEIDTYIRGLLAEFELPTNIPIVFGSAAWAKMMAYAPLDDDPSDRLQKSLERLVTERQAAIEPDDTTGAPGSTESSTRRLDDLSGLHELRQVIATQAARGIAAPALRNIARDAIDLTQQSAVLLKKTLGSQTPLRPDLDIEALIDRLDRLLKTVNDECERITTTSSEEMLFKISEAYYTFVSTETKALKRLILDKGDPNQWAPDVEDLQRHLNRSYNAFRESSMAAVSALFAETAREVEAIYGTVLSRESDLFDIEPPAVQEPPTPAILMRTTEFDVAGSWLSGWLARRNGGDAYVKRFSDITSKQLKATTKEMQDIYVVSFLRAARTSLHRFLSEHIETLQNLLALDDDEKRDDLRKRLGVEQSIRDRISALETIAGALSTLKLPNASAS